MEPCTNNLSGWRNYINITHELLNQPVHIFEKTEVWKSLTCLSIFSICHLGSCGCLLCHRDACCCPCCHSDDCRFYRSGGDSCPGGDQNLVHHCSAGFCHCCSSGMDAADKSYRVAMNYLRFHLDPAASAEAYRRRCSTVQTAAYEAATCCSSVDWRKDWF